MTESNIIEISNALESIIGTGVKITKKEEVKEYLTNYPDIMDITVRMCEKAYEKFGQNSELNLEVSLASKDKLAIYLHPKEYDKNKKYDKNNLEEFCRQLLADVENICRPFDEELYNKQGWIFIIPI